jgi:hypothetical protein
MQLDKVVGYHKALADATRIRMMILLASGELNGLVLAEKLGVSPATITHHATKLREASLIRERRDKNTIFFSVDHYFLKSNSAAALELIYTHSDEKGSDESMEDSSQRLKQSVIKNFFTADGKLKHLPAQLKKKLIVLEQLVSQLDKNRTYTEKEINEFIKQYHDDFATIRREFIMHQFMYRDNEVYEMNPAEMWKRWDRIT